MVFKKKQPAAEQPPQEEQSEDSPPVASKKDAVFVCVRKCYFNLTLWQIDDETGYLPGIENCEYFEEI